MKYIQGDCLNIPLPDDSCDLVFCSPPYEDARTYGMNFKLKGRDWVEWAAPRYLECLRVCRGLVAWVVEGRTRKFEYSATPIHLMAALSAEPGVKLRKPPVYKRFGIPGSGGPDWLRNDYEFIVCATKRGRLPWSDKCAMGKAPKYRPGGAMSNRIKNGERVSQTSTFRNSDGSMHTRRYKHPKIANPGNVIDCGAVGGGRMGHPLAHCNEAPFPLDLAVFFVRSFCLVGGVVLDPFGGSGTTAHAAVGCGRQGIHMDIRESQIDLCRRRMADPQGVGE